jgi:hypothetical protein
LNCPQLDITSINARATEEREERRMEICAVEFLALVRTKCVGPTVEDAVITEPVPQDLVLIFGATFAEDPIPESHSTYATKRVVIMEVLRPLIVAATPEDRQVRVKKVIRYFIRRLTIRGR